MSDHEESKDVCSVSCQGLMCSNSRKIVYQKTTTTTISRFGDDAPTVQEVNDALLMYNLNQENLNVSQKNETSITPQTRNVLKNIQQTPDQQSSSFKQELPKLETSNQESKKNESNIQEKVSLPNVGKDVGVEAVDETTDCISNSINMQNNAEERNINVQGELPESNVDNQEELQKEIDVNLNDNKKQENLDEFDVNIDKNNEESTISKPSQNKDNICNIEVCAKLHGTTTGCLPNLIIKTNDVPIINSPEITPATTNAQKIKKCNSENCPSLTKSLLKEFDTSVEEMTRTSVHNETENSKKLRKHIENMTSEDIEQLTNALEAQIIKADTEQEKGINKFRKEPTDSISFTRRKNLTKAIEKEMNEMARKLEQPSTCSNAKSAYKRNYNFETVGNESRKFQPKSNVIKSYPTINQANSYQDFNALRENNYMSKQNTTLNNSYSLLSSTPETKFITPTRPSEEDLDCICYKKLFRSKSTPNTNTTNIPFFSIPTYRSDAVGVNGSVYAIIRRTRTITIVTSTPINEN